MDTTTTTITMMQTSPLTRKRKTSTSPLSSSVAEDSSSSSLSDDQNPIESKDGGERKDVKDHHNQQHPSKRARQTSNKKEFPASSVASFSSPTLGDIQLDEDLESRIYIEQAILQLEQQEAAKKKKKQGLQQQQADADPPSHALAVSASSSSSPSSSSRIVIIKEGFSWTSYPMLEDFLCREARSFFKWQQQKRKSSGGSSGGSSRKSSSSHAFRAKQAYNDSLTRQLRTIAHQHGYSFAASIDDHKLRHAAKCYYKNVVDGVMQKHMETFNQTGKWDDNFRTIVMGLQQLQKSKNSSSSSSNSGSKSGSNNSKKSAGILKQRRDIQADAAAAARSGQEAVPRAGTSITGSSTAEAAPQKPLNRNEVLHRRLEEVFQSPPRKKKSPKLKAKPSQPKPVAAGTMTTKRRHSPPVKKKAAVAVQPSTGPLWQQQAGHSWGKVVNGKKLASSTSQEYNSPSNSSMSSVDGDKQSVLLTRPSVAVPKTNERIHQLWMRVKGMDCITTNYPSILSEQDVPIWQSLQTLQALIHVHFAADMPNFAVRLCHDELSSLYQNAIKLMQEESLPKSASQLVVVRDKLAAAWCVYAQTLADLGALYYSTDSKNSMTDNGQECNGGGDDETASVSSWLDSAFSALSLAAGCRLVGNHSYITVALARLLLLHWSGCSSRNYCHEKNDGVLLDSEAQNVIKDTLETAFKICCDGIDRARVQKFEPRQDLMCESISQDHLSNLSQLLLTVAVNKQSNSSISPSKPAASLKDDQTASLKDDQTPRVKFRCTADTLVASMTNIIQAKNSLQSPSLAQGQAEPAQFLFVDKKSIRSLCHELNRLSHISEVLGHVNNEVTKELKIRKARGRHASPSGIDILSLFQPLDVVVSDHI